MNKDLSHILFCMNSNINEYMDDATGSGKRFGKRVMSHIDRLSDRIAKFIVRILVKVYVSIFMEKVTGKTIDMDSKTGKTMVFLDRGLSTNIASNVSKRKEKEAISFLKSYLKKTGDDDPHSSIPKETIIDGLKKKGYEKKDSTIKLTDEYIQQNYGKIFMANPDLQSKFEADFKNKMLYNSAFLEVDKKYRDLAVVKKTEEILIQDVEELVMDLITEYEILPSTIRKKISAWVRSVFAKPKADTALFTTWNELSSDEREEYLLDIEREMTEQFYELMLYNPKFKELISLKQLPYVNFAGVPNSEDGIEFAWAAINKRVPPLHIVKVKGKQSSWTMVVRNGSKYDVEVREDKLTGVAAARFSLDGKFKGEYNFTTGKVTDVRR